MLKVKIKLGEGAVLPVKAHLHDAAYDLRTAEDIEIPSSAITTGRRKVLTLNLSIELPAPCDTWYWKLASKIFGLDKYTYCAKIHARSGNGSKGMPGVPLKPESDNGKIQAYKYKVYDCDVIKGIVDQNYRDNIGVIVRNKDGRFFIPKGTKVAQMTIERAYEVGEWIKVDKLSPSERDGGFGKTGIR